MAEPHTSSSTQCPIHKAEEPEKPFIQNGQISFQAHHVGWMVCGFFTAIAIVVSWWLIDKHLTHYTNKGQQRYIIRCLLMVPIYSLISTLSYILYDSYASPLILVRDAYEALVLHAFFYLLLEYISHDPEQQKEVFRKLELKRWMWPMGWVKYRPSGLYFLQLMKWGVLQYAVLRPLCTLIGLVLHYFGLYCEASWHPRWAHLHIITIISLSVTVAMYCLIQLYLPIAKNLKPYRPLLKFFSIKAVVFLTFWQATFLAVLAAVGVVKSTKYMTAEEINIGFAAILQTFEMMLFAFLHLRAFSYHPYRDDNVPKTGRWRSLGHVFDYRDLWRQFWEGLVYMWLHIRGFEAEPTGRMDHLEKAMGRSRIRHRSGTQAGPEHQWLAADIEKSQNRPTDDDVNSELRRLANLEELDDKNTSIESTYRNDDSTRSKHKREGAKSFWKVLYDRVATQDAEPDHREDMRRGLMSSGKSPRRQTQTSTKSPPWVHAHARHASDDYLDDEPPVPSFMITSRPSRADDNYHINMARMLTPPPPSLLPSTDSARSPPRPPPKDGRGGPEQVQNQPSYHLHVVEPSVDRSLPLNPSDRTSLIRGDSLLDRVFSADISSSEHGTGSSSARTPSEYAPLSGPWLTPNIMNMGRTSNHLDALPQQQGPRVAGSKPRRASQKAGLDHISERSPSDAGPSIALERFLSSSPTRLAQENSSSQLSNWMPRSGPINPPTAAHPNPSAPLPGPQTYPYTPLPPPQTAPYVQTQPQRAESTRVPRPAGPRLPTGLVMPSPLSPARFPAPGIAPASAPPVSNPYHYHIASADSPTRIPAPEASGRSEIRGYSQQQPPAPSSSYARSTFPMPDGNRHLHWAPNNPAPYSQPYPPRRNQGPTRFPLEIGDSSAGEGPKHPALHAIHTRNRRRSEGAHASSKTPGSRDRPRKKSRPPPEEEKSPTSVVPMPWASPISDEGEDVGAQSLSRLLRSGESRFPSVQVSSSPSSSPTRNGAGRAKSSHAHAQTAPRRHRNRSNSLDPAILTGPVLGGTLPRMDGDSDAAQTSLPRALPDEQTRVAQDNSRRKPRVLRTTRKAQK